MAGATGPKGLHRANTGSAPLNRKARWAQLSIFVERLWPRVWPLLAVLGAFLLVSLAGIWPRLGEIAHISLLAVFGLAALAAIVLLIRTPWPSRESAIHRIETYSGVAHRPASSYEDTLSEKVSDPATRAVWERHRKRLYDQLKSLRVAPPQPDTAKRDPLALRALLLLLVCGAMAFFGNQAGPRLTEAFELRAAKIFKSARIDAWVTPPAYTRKAPVMLADGGKARSVEESGAESSGVITIPEKSVLIARASGVTSADLQLEVLTEAEGSKIIEAAAPKLPGGRVGSVAEIKYPLERNARIRLLISGNEAARWTFAVVPDNAPTIELVKPPEATPRGSMELTYRVKDDYAVARARVDLKKTQSEDADPSTAWARTDLLKGPRPPLERIPELRLRLPPGSSENGEAVTHLEIGSHPWSGLDVELTLEATDVAGQTGRSETLKMKLPQRRFTNPLARAVVEQRSKLIQDPRYREAVMTALDALTLAPESFIDDTQVYLGLRTVRYRLDRDQTRDGRKSVIDQLWHIALRIEDGDLSDAERRLREAQERLSELLDSDASQEEIERAMQELRQALNEFMQQLQKQAQENPMQPQNGQDPNSEFLSQQDLEQMMKDLEQMAKSGAREQAQQMLSQMRDMLDRLQQGQTAQNQQQSEQQQQLQQAMKDLGDLVGQQQRLMDDTYGQQRQQGQQRGQQGQQRGQPQRRRGPQSGAQQGQRPGQGQQQGGRQANRNGQGQSGEQGLRGRQEALRQRLRQLQRDLSDGAGMSPQELENAEQAMRNAEQALDDGNLAEATREQGRALDQMRQSAQEMAEQMMQNSPQRYGRNGDAPRDPLGRPQRSEGPDQGTSVRVPDEIDIQRAREILQELRSRLADPNRPSIELEYIERLLRRF